MSQMLLRKTDDSSKISSPVFKKDDSGYEGDDLSLIDDLDSLDDALAASNMDQHTPSNR